jgi:hypothetical protein
MALAAASCAAKRPVLYPNNHLKMVGADAAQSDIETCSRLASRSGAGQNRTAKAVESSATAAATGAAAGAAVGAITGNVGQGAAAGAAGGGAGGFVRGASRSRDPDPVHRRFVEKCLRDKGYEPIGWR